MIVVADASVIVPALIESGDSGGAVRARLIELTQGQPLRVVHSVTQIEVITALRTLTAQNRTNSEEAEHALRAFVQLPTIRHDVTQPMVMRIWELRHVMTPHDATYVALVERLVAEELQPACLATADCRLAQTPHLSIDVELFEP